MRKLVAAMTMYGMMMTSSGFSGESAKWAKYNELKNVKGNSISETVQAKIAIAEFAEANLEDRSIAGWAYNNAAFELIKEFKAKTNYNTNTQDIFTAEKSWRKELRKKLQQTFDQSMPLLTEASIYLQKAKDATTDSKVLTKVRSNEQFIQWVQGFTVKKQ